jgi:hypothetical protein
MAPSSTSIAVTIQVAKPKAPVWLREAFRDGVDERLRATVAPYKGANPLCWLAQFDSKQIACCGPLERTHLIPRQRVENAFGAQLLGVRTLCMATDGDYGTCTLPEGHDGRYHREDRSGDLWAEWSGVAPPTWVLIAAWDARNGKISCEGHHRRFDSHAVSPEAPKIVVPPLALPMHTVEFVFDYGLEPQAEDRFPGFNAALCDDR